MPAFMKSPKFIAGTILVIWLAYVIYANFQREAVVFTLMPLGLLTLQLRLSGVVIGSAIFGAALTMIVQFMWRRGSSNSSPTSSAASASSSKTVA